MGCTMRSSCLADVRATRRSVRTSSLRSTLPPRDDAGKRRLDRPDRLAFIEAMHASIGVEHRDAGSREMRGRRRFAHADPAGEADDEHHAASKRCGDMGSELRRHFGADAEPALEARHRLMQQHAEPVDGDGSRARAPRQAARVSSGL